MRRVMKMSLVFLIIYPFGIMLGFAVMLMCLIKALRILHWKRFPYFKKKVIIVANHPSLADPFLIASMFFYGFLLNPFAYGPLLVADRKNFYDSWWFFWLRPFMISVDRGNRESEAKSIRQIIEALNKGKRIVIFPEGGRTCRGKDFLYSNKGKKIRKFKNGVGLIIRRTKAAVIPVWLDGTDDFFPNSTKRLFYLRFGVARMKIKIGQVINFEKNDMPDSEQVTRIITDALLKLADE